MNTWMYLDSKSLIGALLIALTPFATVAQPQTGDRELQLLGGFFHTQGADSGTITLDASIGKYYSDQWLLGIQQGLNYAFIDNANDQWSASTVFFGNYHFAMRDNKWQPFVGGFIGALYNEDDATGTIGPHVGVKYYADDRTFVMFRYRYEWAIDELDLDSVKDSVDDNSSDGNHVITIGMGINF